MDRRFFLAGLVSGALVPEAFAHTIYNQWIVYRKKHLHIGCHRHDGFTFTTAGEVADVINHSYPEASARVARAPFPGRIASLMATGQMEVAVLSHRHAIEISQGIGEFSPYGAVPLHNLASLTSDYYLVAHADFPIHHGWLVASALADSKLASVYTESALPVHQGALAWLSGKSFEEVDGIKNRIINDEQG